MGACAPNGLQLCDAGRLGRDQHSARVRTEDGLDRLVGHSPVAVRHADQAQVRVRPQMWGNLSVLSHEAAPAAVMDLAGPRTRVGHVPLHLHPATDAVPIRPRAAAHLNVERCVPARVRSCQLFAKQCRPVTLQTNQTLVCHLSPFRSRSRILLLGLAFEKSLLRANVFC